MQSLWRHVCASAVRMDVLAALHRGAALHSWESPFPGVLRRVEMVWAKGSWFSSKFHIRFFWIYNQAIALEARLCWKRNKGFLETQVFPLYSKSQSGPVQTMDYLPSVERTQDMIQEVLPSLEKGKLPPTACHFIFKTKLFLFIIKNMYLVFRLSGSQLPKPSEFPKRKEQWEHLLL